MGHIKTRAGHEAIREATEASAEATQVAAAATREQAVLAREAVRARTTPSLLPTTASHDWLDRPLKPSWRPMAWPVIWCEGHERSGPELIHTLRLNDY